MFVPIKIEYRHSIQSLFLTEPNELNLIKDIEGILCELSLSILDISSQRTCVLELNHRIKSTIDFFKHSFDDYHIHKLLNSFKHFIIISDRSLSNFKVSIQVMVNNNVYYCNNY